MCIRDRHRCKEAIAAPGLRGEANAERQAAAWGDRRDAQVQRLLKKTSCELFRALRCRFFSAGPRDRRHGILRASDPRAEHETRSDQQQGADGAAVVEHGIVSMFERIDAHLGVSVPSGTGPLARRCVSATYADGTRYSVTSVD